MYSILLALAVGLVFGVGGMLLGWWGWVWALVLGLVVAIVALVLILRRVGKWLGPAMTQVRKQAEAGMFAATMQSLQDLLPRSRWVPMLRGQLYAQMGGLAFQSGDHDQALALLQQSSRRVSDAQLLLAVIWWRKGDKQRAFDTLKIATAVNTNHPLLHNTYAFLLNREKRVDDAIAHLARYRKKMPADEASKNNLLRLQNNQRMDMKAFGLNWYVLGFEQPPASMGQLRQGRKGFRTPPMRRGG
jgi:tetratricopeptide (TPR) repeat protein